jgi:hypothetical protein
LGSKYSVKLLSRAYSDLDGVYAYIAQKLIEPGVAGKLVDSIEEANKMVLVVTVRYSKSRF